MTLAGKRIFITGGSRGIGLAIALRAAADGASIAIAAKTSDPNPKLPGTIHTAAAEIEAAGGKALAIQCDLRDANQIEAAVNQAAEAFGGEEAGGAEGFGRRGRAEAVNLVTFIHFLITWECNHVFVVLVSLF